GCLRCPRRFTGFLANFNLLRASGERKLHACARLSPGQAALMTVLACPPDRLRSVILVLVADEVQLARLDLVDRAPVLERFLAAVGDPHFGGLEFADGHRELVPVSMVGD